jgi:tRNA threonylcarbamoyladenosine modification (KEOPS) complex  Pcc1 subunit
MSNSTYFSVKSTIELIFKDLDTCTYAYNSFLPELEKAKSHRSRISMEKKDKILLFSIESADITAFRASASDIISLGKIIESTLKLCQ